MTLTELPAAPADPMAAFDRGMAECEALMAYSAARLTRAELEEETRRAAATLAEALERLTNEVEALRRRLAPSPPGHPA